MQSLVAMKEAALEFRLVLFAGLVMLSVLSGGLVELSVLVGVLGEDSLVMRVALRRCNVCVLWFGGQLFECR